MGTDGLRILHVISSFDFSKGGTTAALLGMAVSQKRAGLETSIVATWTEPHENAATEQAEEAGVPVTLVGPAKGRFQSHPQLKPTLQQQIAQADIIHIHALYEDIQHIAAVTSRKLQKPYVISPHGMLDPYILAHNRWLKKAYMFWRLRKDLNCAKALCYTTPTEQKLVEPLKLKPTGVVETLGIHLEEFEHLPARGFLRQRMPDIGQRRIVLFLSRVHEKKGLDLLVPAFAQAKLENAVLVIAGPDSEDGYMQKVKGFARQAGIEDKVFSTGMLHGKERIQAYVDAELFALCSYQENFGIVVPEALAAGLPVVISDQVNVCDDVKKFEVGTVVPTRQEKLTEAIQYWMTDENERLRVGQLARKTAFEQYDWNRIGERWVGHYEKIVQPVRGEA